MKNFVHYFLIFLVAAFVLVPYAEAQTLSFETERNEISSKVFIEKRVDDDFTTNCADFAKGLRIGGYLIYAVKILLPIIIIVKSSIDMLALVTSGSSSELNKQGKKMAWSLIAAIFIFFIPSLLDTIFGFIDSYNDNKTDDSEICAACIFDPFSDDCTKYIKTEE